jgi:hypothetical protein
VTRLAVALFLAAVVAATVAAPADAQREEVTLRMERFYDNACRCYKLRFSGTLASGQANEYVAVVQQPCGQTGSTSIAGASTREGGFWQAETTGSYAPSGSFRARWNNQLSEPVSHRADVPISVAQLGGGRVRVSVFSFSSSPLKLKGKVVELQRLSAGQWTRVRRARFSARRPGAFTATFSVRARGMRLRAFVPAESAAPCYAATASEPWSSGAAAPGGSDRIIDRTYLCSVAMQGGIRELSVSASGLVPTDFAPRRSFAVSSNWPDGALTSASTDVMTLNPTRCAASRSRIPLESRGLQGGSVGAERRSFECETPARVLVRIRGVFAARAAFTEDRTALGHRQLKASGQVNEAALAIRTLSGKPFGFASFSASGGVRLFVARGCVDDS